MKKIICILFVLAIALSFVGCEGDLSNYIKLTSDSSVSFVKSSQNSTDNSTVLPAVSSSQPGLSKQEHNSNYNCDSSPSSISTADSKDIAEIKTVKVHKWFYATTYDNNNKCDIFSSIIQTEEELDIVFSGLDKSSSYYEHLNDVKTNYPPSQYTIVQIRTYENRGGAIITLDCVTVDSNGTINVDYYKRMSEIGTMAICSNHIYVVIDKVENVKYVKHNEKLLNGIMPIG